MKKSKPSKKLAELVETVRARRAEQAKREQANPWEKAKRLFDELKNELKSLLDDDSTEVIMAVDVGEELEKLIRGHCKPG